MTTQIDHDSDPLLEKLLVQLGQTQPPQAQPSILPIDTAPDRGSSRRTHAKVNDGPAFWLAALAFSLALWVVGGYFTLVLLHALYPPIVAVVGWPWQLDGAVLICWLIPIVVSALEFGSVKRRGAALLAFALVAAFDLGSTTFGMREWVDQRMVFGFMLSGAVTGANVGMLITIAVASGVLTFAPEYIMRRGIGVLWALVR